jgi:glutaminase
MDYASILQEIQEESNGFPTKGNVTTIPELAKVSPNKFGIHLTTIEGRFWVGDSNEKFSIQSISKALLWLCLSFRWKIWEEWVEPSGTAFNSLIQLEHEKVSRNPFINAGAIVMIY